MRIMRLRSGRRVPGPNVYTNITITDPLKGACLTAAMKPAAPALGHRRLVRQCLQHRLDQHSQCRQRRFRPRLARGQFRVLECEMRPTDVSSPPTAQNWVIGGSTSSKQGTAIYDQFGTTVTPQSLYIAQLLDRLTPTVATAAAASPSTVTGTTTSLSVLGADGAGESTLNYTWSVLSGPTGAAAVAFSVNGTNASKNTVATFGQAGKYTLQATIQYPGGFSAVSTVSVTVNQTLTGIAVSPGPVSINENTPQQFTALATDQFGNPMTATVNWGATGGSINNAGLYTSPATPNNYTVTATNGLVSGSATVTVLNAAAVLSAAATASPAPVTGTTTSLSALALGDTGQASLTYTWSATLIPAGASALRYSAPTAPMPPRTRQLLSAALAPTRSKSPLPTREVRLPPAA